MRIVLIYWLIGCALIGYSLGNGYRKCPNDARLTQVETVAAIAIWPAVLVGALAMIGGNYQTECSAKTEPAK